MSGRALTRGRPTILDMATIAMYSMTMTDRLVSSALYQELKQTRPFRSPGEEAFVAVLKTADVLRRRMTRLVEPAGLTLQQYNVLRILRGAHPHPLPTLEIRERLIEEAPGITRFVDALESAGLIRRERSVEDRRLVHCAITDAGLALLASLDSQIDAVDDATVDGVSKANVRTLLNTLAMIRSANAGG